MSFYSNVCIDLYKHKHQNEHIQYSQFHVLLFVVWLDGFVWASYLIYVRYNIQIYTCVCLVCVFFSFFSLLICLSFTYCGFFLYWICEWWRMGWMLTTIQTVVSVSAFHFVQRFIFTSYSLFYCACVCVCVFFAWKDIWTLWIVIIVHCCCCFCCCWCCCDAAISITHKNTKNAFIHQIQTFGLCSGNAHHSGVYINSFGACSMYASHERHSP